MDIEFIKRLIDIEEYELAGKALDLMLVEKQAQDALTAHESGIGQP